MFDFHVHTNFSGDCTIEMESYILPAIEKGLTGICFTDHIDIDYPTTDAAFELDYKKYIHEIRKLKDKYENQLKIYTGIEFGMQPHILESDTIFFHDKNFDYILGSIHCAGKRELYQGDFLVGKTEKQGIINYFEDMIYCAKHFKAFHNLGHLDGISRYVSTGVFAAADYMDYIEEVLRTIIYEGKGLEVNTSGKRYNLPHFHPETSILKLYKQLGGEIVTLGSDSHNPKTLGYGFHDARDMLHNLGFHYYTIFKNGKPQFIKL